MLRFCCLASGSSGNATLIEATDGLQRTRVLVDCGLGWRQLLQRLAMQGLGPEDIDAVFITHEHGDHVGCAPVLSARHHIALHTSAGTWQALHGTASGLPAAAAPTTAPAQDGQMLRIGALGLLPFTVPHDAREPLQLRCTDGDRVLGMLTDLGHITPRAAPTGRLPCADAGKQPRPGTAGGIGLSALSQAPRRRRSWPSEQCPGSPRAHPAQPCGAAHHRRCPSERAQQPARTGAHRLQRSTGLRPARSAGGQPRWTGRRLAASLSVKLFALDTPTLHSRRKMQPISTACMRPCGPFITFGGVERVRSMPSRPMLAGTHQAPV